MRRFEDARNPVFLHVLRNEYREQLECVIVKIKSKYPLSEFDLEYLFTCLRNDAMFYSEKKSPYQLKDGKRYGVLRLSPHAFAQNPNTGEWMRNHGDIYIEEWMWDEEKGMFSCKNAWGSVYEKPYTVFSGTTLIELGE